MRSSYEVAVTVRKSLYYSILGDITGFPDRRLQVFVLGERQEANQPDKKIINNLEDRVLLTVEQL